MAFSLAVEGAYGKFVRPLALSVAYQMNPLSTFSFIATRPGTDGLNPSGRFTRVTSGFWANLTPYKHFSLCGATPEDNCNLLGNLF
jgi:hypothetical protein